MQHGKAFKIALIKLDKTQISVAKELGVNPQLVNQWSKKTRFTEEQMQMVLSVLGMKESELVALVE